MLVKSGNLLSNNEKWGYGTLKRKSGLKDKELGAALGLVIERE